MKIIDILNLLNTEKSITILTPNYIECKLLYDRIKLSVVEDIQLIDTHTIQINDSKINFITPDNLDLSNSISTIIVEFPDDFPHFILKNLKASDIIFSYTEII